MKYLVIVESPGKIIKIQKYLNELYNDSKFIVKASFGHCKRFRFF
jgi:DNA topoisomerase IA